MKIEFDRFELDTEQKAVTGPDGPVILRAQTLAVLCHLIEQAPAVVSRDELLDAVWGHQATSVSSVAQTIKELRQALGDSSSSPHLIATRRRLGYQFIGNIHEPPCPEAAESVPIVQAEPQSSMPGSRRWPWPALAITGVLVIAVVLWVSGDHQHLAIPTDRPPTLAIAEMVNATDDPQLNWLGPALETYLGHALVELGGFRVMAVDRLSMTDEARLAEIDFLVEGRYLTAGVDGSRLLASLRRPGSSEIVTSVESGLSGWDVASLSIEAASAIRERLGFSAPADASPSALRSRLPHTPGAQRAWFEAMNAIGHYQPDHALAAILRAREYEPDDPRLDHLEALAHQVRGDLLSAREASERAMTATRLWPHRERLDLEATAAMLDFDFERAADNLQALTRFYPEQHSNLRLIEALIEAGRLRAANEALNSLRLQLPRDPRVALLTARLAQVERDHEGRIEAAKRAVLLARDEGLEDLLPAALLSEAGGLIELGRLDEARNVMDTLFDLSEPLSGANLALAHLGLARILFQQGDLDPALTSVERAESVFKQIPHPAGIAEANMVAGAIHDRAGRVEASLEILEQAVNQFARLGDQRRLARANVQLGITLMRANQTDLAIEHLDQGARYFRVVGDRQGEGAALLNHATLLARAGRLIDAEPVFERSLEAFTDAGDLRGQAMALGNLAGIAGDRRDMRRSIELAEHSLAMFERLGAQTDIARVSYNLALVHRRRGDLLNAESRIRQSAEAFADQGATLMQTRALTTLGAILVSMGRFDDLEPVIEQIESLEIEDPAEQSVFRTVLGERALLQGDLAAANHYFDQAYSLMEVIGAENHLLVSRLNLARLALAQGELINAEQEARELLFAFGEIRATSRQIDALLLLAGTLIEQQRTDEAISTLSEVDSLLIETPDAELSLRLALLRSRVSDPELARQRLDWAEETAARQGFQPLKIQARSMKAEQG